MPEEAPEGQEPEEEPQEGSQEPEPESFDREYVEKLRKEAASYRTKVKELEPLASKAKELEDAKKSEAEKLNETLSSVTKERDDASSHLVRLQVALEKAPEGMGPKEVAKWAKRLTGSSREELEEDADELFEDFSSKSPPSRTPKANLRGGTDPSEEGTVDGEQIADRILGSNRIG